MKINEKFILYGIAITLALMLVLVSLGIISINIGGKTIGSPVSSGDYANLPEKCRPPAGQEINSWKEHLGHHEDTKECLKYFN